MNKEEKTKEEKKEEKKEETKEETKEDKKEDNLKNNFINQNKIIKEIKVSIEEVYNKFDYLFNTLKIIKISF
jgi:hypothetical protein